MAISKNAWQKILSFGLVLATTLFFIPTQINAAETGQAQWAKSTVVAPGFSYVEATAIDSEGSVYVVGHMNGGQFTFGNGVTATGAKTGSYNAFIVKYNASGVAQWAKSPGASSSNGSDFTSVAVDSFDNVYVSGYLGAGGADTQFDFGSGVTATAKYHNGNNAVLVKYGKDGVAQWTSSPSTAPENSVFMSVAIDASNNAYAVGYINTNTQFAFYNGVTVTGSYATGSNAVIVRYSANGNGAVQWAKTATTAPHQSRFAKATVDSSGKIDVAGMINGNGEFNFGNSVKASGIGTSDNQILIQYASDGTAQWANTPVAASNNYYFQGLTTDSARNIYIAGAVQGNLQYDFGDGVTLTGVSTSHNALLIKYASDGTAEWAKSPAVEPAYSFFEGIAMSSAGDLYLAGYIVGTGQYDFGNNVTVTGAGSNANALLIKYNSSGVAQWAQSTATAPAASIFAGVALDSQNTIYAAGYVDNDGQYDFGNNKTVAGNFSNAENALIVKYIAATVSSPTPTPTPTPTTPVFANLPNSSTTINLTEGQTVTVNPFTIQVKPTSNVGIQKVEFYIDDILIGTATTPDSTGAYSYAWDTSKYHSNVKVIAYDTNGGTTTLTRSTIVNLASTASSPAATQIPALTELPATGAHTTREN